MRVQVIEQFVEEKPKIKSEAIVQDVKTKQSNTLTKEEILKRLMGK